MSTAITTTSVHHHGFAHFARAIVDSYSALFDVRYSTPHVSIRRPLSIGEVVAMDNSGSGPLRVPGFGDIPVNYQLPLDKRFAHGVLEWRQSLHVTAQERAMVAVMNRLTDDPNWFEDVFDDAILAEWRAELERQQFIPNPRLMRDKAWTWCIEELRDKARSYQKDRYVRVLDTGACVCKADGADLASLTAVIRRALVPLVDEYCQESEERARRQQSLQNLTGRISATYARPFDAEPRPPSSTTALAEQQQPSEMRAHGQEVDGHTYAANVDTDKARADNKDLGDLNDAYYSWTPVHGGRRLNIEGSAHMITALVDPTRFPLIYGRSLVLTDGGTVATDDILPSYGAATTPPVPLDLRNAHPHVMHEMNAWSTKYQRLPCEVAFTDDGGVRITSYINGLHPDHAELYTAIEEVLARAIAPWNECVVRGHAGLESPNDYSQLGRVPLRILTYGIEWDNELPDWAAAFRQPGMYRVKKYAAEKEEIRNLPDNSAERQLRLDDLAVAFPDVECMVDTVDGPIWQLPPLNSVLWQRAAEYLGRPEPDLLLCSTSRRACGPTKNKEPLPPADWVPGDDRTWMLLEEKAKRILQFRHPEPGTVFSYDDWKHGRHTDRPIVPMAGPTSYGYSGREKIRPHKPYAVALEESFRNAGLQVLVEISSIDLTPETPAYAPDAAERMAVYAARERNHVQRGLSCNQYIELDMQPDADGYRMAGEMLNEHVAAVAVLALDVDNVTTPHLRFCEKGNSDFSLYTYWEHRNLPHDYGILTGDNSHWFYSADWPARLAGKVDDIGVLGEIFGVSELFIDSNVSCGTEEPCVGVVALRPGRLVTFPSILPYRLDPFHLKDATRPGRLRWLTLSLVDPHYRICSTRNVPPQPHGWWRTAVRRAVADAAAAATAAAVPFGADRRAMPSETEVLDEVLQGTEGLPMGLEEAELHRLRMAEEAQRAYRYRCWP